MSGGRGKNGKNGKNGKVGKIVERLKELKENEGIPMRITEDLDDYYVAEIGYYGKNGRGSYQVKLKYGINGLLKIRNRADFEQIKTVIEFLDKNPEYLEAIEQLNGGKTVKPRKTVEYI